MKRAPAAQAAEIPDIDKSTKFQRCFTSSSSDVEAHIQYPSFSPLERCDSSPNGKRERLSYNRYSLVKPLHDDSAFHAISDIVAVMRTVSKYYIPIHARYSFDDEINGYPQRLVRALKKQLPEEFQKVVKEYNHSLLKMLQDCVVGRELDQDSYVPSKLVEQILNQSYSRTVSPNLTSLKLYEAGTDNVYGELLPRFVSEILREDVRMASDQVFVDLGSGVGNVVLQAALEVGCESWGCEVMDHFCDIADRQHVEFVARCRVWGLSVGKIRLERGDFLAHETVKNVLKRADIVLVNNQVFTPALNEALTTLFLDLKDGCRVVSLKSFVPSGYKITARNLENPLNLLRVQAKTYYSNCVSWTSQGGSYYVSTKDSSRIQRFKITGRVD